MSAPTMPESSRTANAQASAGVATPARRPVDRSAGDPMWLRLVVSVLVLIIGTASLRAAWAGMAAWPLLILAGLVGGAAAYALGRMRVAFALRLLVLALVPVLLLIAVGRQAGKSALAGVADSFPTLLTSPYPAQLTLPLLAPGLVIAWVAGCLLGGALPLRRFFLAPLAAGLVLLISGDLLSGGGSDRTGWISMALVAVILASWSGWVTRRRSGPPPGTGLAIVLGAVALAVGWVPLGTPFQPRDLVSRPEEAVSEPNVLPMLGAWAERQEEEILRRSGDTYPLHLAVYPDYDGVTFNSISKYADIGDTRAPLLPPGRFQKELTTTVTWKPITRWVPAPGVPTEVTIPGARLDPDTGALISPQVPNGGVVSYTVTGSVDAPRLAELAAADIGQADRYTALPPNTPGEFAAYAKEVTKNSATYLDQVQAIERTVKADRKFVATAPGGSSLPRLRSFLFDNEDKGGRLGTSEQFAASFAILTRSLGIPTRVVVGFGQGSPLATDPNVNVVRGRDAAAWPEVYFAGFGWVPFNPTPDLSSVQPPTANRQQRPPPPRPTPVPTPAVPPAPLLGADDLQWWWIPAGALGLGLLGVGGLTIARRVRRNRQQQAGALGAWRLLRDSLRLSGRPPEPNRAAVSVAAATGVPEAETVARAAETASFAPAAVDAPAVWDTARAADRALRGQASGWQRLVWSFSPAVWLKPKQKAAKPPRRTPRSSDSARSSSSSRSERVKRT